MSESTPRLPAIAIGLAVTAVVLAGVAVIVVATRGASVEVAAQSPAPAPPANRRVAAVDVVELENNGVEPASEHGAVIGVKVVDPSVRNLLGLAATDVITAISGRAVRRPFDVYDVLVGTSMMNATALYVELVHDGQPVLVRWELDGDLRQARRGRPSSALATGTMPSMRPVRDPLLDTIQQLDDRHFVVPRATIDQIATNFPVFAQGTRAFPTRVGAADGIRIFVVRPTSALWALGLRSGDSIRAVNGVAIADPAHLAEVYDQVKAAASLRIELMRRGTAEVIEITQTP